MTTYNKVIRDRIPEIIDKSGKISVVHRLADDDFLLELEKKLIEEVQEYFTSRSIEELADLVEIIYRILELREIGREELERIRLEKLRKRGGFSDNLFLIEVKT